MRTKEKQGLCIVLAFVAFSAAALCKPARIAVVELQRGEESDVQTEIVLEAEWEGVHVTERIPISLEARAPNGTEVQKQVTEFADGLTDRILGNNASPDRILEDLNLIEYDADTGIAIRWLSDRPDLIEADGRVYSNAAETGTTVRLVAELQKEDVTVQKELFLTMAQPETEAEKKSYLSARIRRDWKEWVAAPKTSSKVTLFAQTDDGISLSWQKETPSYFRSLLVLTGCGSLLLALLQSTEEKKKKRNRQIAFQRAYPLFLDRLLLYMNAGLITENAILRCAENGQKDDAFTGRLQTIRQNVKERNASLTEEIRLWAEDTQERKLLQFAVLLEDHLLQGNDLQERLEEEAQELREERKRQVQEKGSTAETKLAFPMMLLLGALILIAIAPVFLTM